MSDLTTTTARLLARKSSRRQFVKFVGAASVGAGLWLSRTDVTLGSVTACASCPGGPCNPCSSPYGNCGTGSDHCKSCESGGGCGVGCTTTGEWYCCKTFPQCRIRCSECSCPTNGCCHCFVMLAQPCVGAAENPLHPCLC